MNSYAGVLHERQKLSEAEPIMREVLAGMRLLLGDRHLDSLTAAHNLASLNYSRGSFVESEALFKEVLNGRQKKLGDRHALCVEAANHLAAAQQARRHAEVDEVGVKLGGGCCFCKCSSLPWCWP